MTISIVAIDDEPLSLARLERLSKTIDGAELVASGDSGLQAIQLVRDHAPDVMLLDINMPGMSGLEAAKHITETFERPPAIIFCTAYEQHGIDAFNANAVGYLLKPIQAVELIECVLNAKKVNSLQLSNLTSVIEDGINIASSYENSKELISSSDVVYFRAEGKSVLAGADGREIVVDYTLKYLEEALGDNFLRVHKSALVNKRKLSRLDTSTECGAKIFLQGSDIGLSVSRRHLSAVKKCFA